jgi:hypothetical protein
VAIVHYWLSAQAFAPVKATELIAISSFVSERGNGILYDLPFGRPFFVAMIGNKDIAPE